MPGASHNFGDLVIDYLLDPVLNKLKNSIFMPIIQLTSFFLYFVCFRLLLCALICAPFRLMLKN